MPRKAFIADLRKATTATRVENISGVRAGDEDGTFTFEYGVITIQALIQDVSDYPANHQFLVFTTSDNAPPAVNSAVEQLSGSLTSITVGQLLSKVSRALGETLSDGPRNASFSIDENGGSDLMIVDGPLQEQEDSSEEGGDNDSTGGWSPQSPQAHFDLLEVSATRVRSLDESLTSALNTRIRSDLHAVKDAGFKVGHLGNMMEGGQDCYVSVSCRIAKLGISEEAMQAWQLDRQQYLIFLVHYTSGYKPLERLTKEENQHARNSIEMRVGVSRFYKPSLVEALATFSVLKRKEQQEVETSNPAARMKPEGEDSSSLQNGFHGLFIGRPLNELLNERVILLLRSRIRMGIGWAGAEAWYNDSQGKNGLNSDIIDEKYWDEDLPKNANALPDIVLADHLADEKTTLVGEPSFPLLGMQFVIRHVVRCTEFCLVCHCKIGADFEALKPYVCSKPLCLYQYMALGFGPSIEYEILSQPHVVDLLVSFCYASARSNRLKDFPTGMSLTVPEPNTVSLLDIGIPSISAPSVPGHEDGLSPRGPMLKENMVSANADAPSEHPRLFKVRFDRSSLEIIFDDIGKAGSKACPVATGTWIMLRIPKSTEGAMHCRIKETTFYPTVKLSPPLKRHVEILQAPLQEQRDPTESPQRSRPPELTPAPSPPLVTLFPAEFIIYNQNFDSLNDTAKRETICLLLDTLPSIQQMKEYLEKGQSLEVSLRTWIDRISPAALGVLRWVIASNRSCIIQVDNIDSTGSRINGSNRKGEQRVYGMGSGWLQFRFAMGAPDKEQRFMNSVREATSTSNLEHPTLFAWHGSPIHNWHGIIREGLHFKDTMHGRAYGHGCYHSLDYHTSASYSGGRSVGRSGYGVHSGGWAPSQLKIASVVSLNEIVNLPRSFVNSRPHLVIDKLDWIQTRFLFVRRAGDEILSEENKPSIVYDQDPIFTPMGERDRIIIPMTAVSKSRRPSIQSLQKGNKKVKILSKVFGNGIVSEDQEEMDQRVEDDAVSIETDAEDIEIFFVEPEVTRSRSHSPIKEGKGKLKLKTMWNLVKEESSTPVFTDFVAGKLEQSNLPLLAPPSYATPSASKTLQRELRTILKFQESQPPHELGWYINPELVSNVYQWIIELHSFEAHLPLAKDMKERDITSVVLELRFGKDYPMSPPFVRVIRPRFVSFMAGGGGHVTAGGALCMELLTNSGWSAVSSIESVLLQVRLAMSNTEPKPARLEQGPVRDYHLGEAVEAYIRACRTHGWEIPKDFQEISSGALSRY
ncbi:MAG: hypothetical protein M1827_005317 [Pycnora praestabilis]|nr:MAG: hypothetical protein M1827_005317 [Pycnora praestabilis]